MGVDLVDLEVFAAGLGFVVAVGFEGFIGAAFLGSGASKS
jgi:hypothetical protein